MRPVNNIERDILAGLEPKERVIALLRKRAGMSPKDFAIAEGFLLNHVYGVIRGATQSDPIASKLAVAVGLERSVLDALIAGEPAATAAAGSP